MPVALAGSEHEPPALLHLLRNVYQKQMGLILLNDLLAEKCANLYGTIL